MRKRSKEEKRRIVEESFQPSVTVVGVARAHRVLPGQIFEWRRAYKEGRLAPESTTPTLLPVRLSDVSSPVSTAGAIYIDLPNARVEIHGAADAVSLGIVLECLAQ
jgi:transposase-like protein